MKVEPSPPEFSARYGAGEAQLISLRLVADLETPAAAMLKLAADRPYSFLLELVEGGAVRGRYSIIGLDPDILWRAHGDYAEINAAPLGTPRRSALARAAHSAPFGHCSSHPEWTSPNICLPCRQACSVTSAMTRCASW